MKKIISFICMTMILLSMSMTALAGSIPEEMLHDDNAQLFFAEVVYYHPDKENPDIELSPVKVIKGDVKTGVKLTYYNPNPIGDFKVKEGNVYLFTYFNEHNPTDIFEVTSYDTSTLKLKNVEGDMWKRFEKYLNEGRYGEAEHLRIDKLNDIYVKTGNTITLTEYLKMDNVSLGSISLFSGPDAVDIDRDKFRKISDRVVLEEIEEEDIEIEDKNGIFITVPDNMEFVYISADGKAAKNNPDGNVLKSVKYIVSSSELAKLRQLFEADAYKLPPLETPLAKDVFYGVVIGIICGGIAGIIIYAVKKKEKSK